MKIYEPNYTQVPNAIISMMPQFTESEFKVIMAIVRKTLGWQKTKDRISLSQLQELTGLGRASVSNAVHSDKFKGIVKIHKGKKGNEFELLIHELSSSKSEPSKKEVVQNLNHSSMNSEPVGSSKSEHTKETITKETKQNKVSARVNGVDVLDGLEEKEIEWLNKYLEYLKESHKIWQTSMQTELVMAKMLKFKNEGYDPVEIIKTVIEANHKKLYKPDNFTRNGKRGKAKQSTSDFAQQLNELDELNEIQ